jgi:predicted ArsR family transcriptional regulator
MPANALLERRRIEAEFTKGILDVLVTEIGRDRAVAILTKAIEAMAEKAGAAFAAETAQGNPEKPADLQAFAQVLPRWQAGEALAVTLHKQDAAQLDFDVTHCAFADMYRELGLGDLGFVLSCNRDGGFSKGFNPAIELTRTQTIMNGAPHCDFRFKLPRPRS